MKLLKWMLIIVVALIVTAVGIGFVIPDTSRVERATVVKAKPATVYAVLNGFRQFNKWSPWAKLDPNTKYTWEGPLSGVGAKQSWSSEDPNVGAGSQEITAVVQDQSINMKLAFADFDSENTSVFTLAPEGEGTRIVWTFEMACKGNIMCRYMGTLMDRVLGPEYEAGLLNLQALLDSLPTDDFTSIQPELVETAPITVAYLAGEATPDQSGPKLGELYAKILAALKAAGAQQTDAPMAITQSFDEATKLWKFEAAIPVDNPALTLPEGSEVKVKQTYGGLAIKATHRGPYAAMEPTYYKLEAYKQARGLEDNGNSWEHYVTDPGKTPEDQLVTLIFWPVK